MLDGDKSDSDFVNSIEKRVSFNSRPSTGHEKRRSNYWSPSRSQLGSASTRKPPCIPFAVYNSSETTQSIIKEIAQDSSLAHYSDAFQPIGYRTKSSLGNMSSQTHLKNSSGNVSHGMPRVKSTNSISKLNSSSSSINALNSTGLKKSTSSNKSFGSVPMSIPNAQQVKSTAPDSLTITSIQPGEVDKKLSNSMKRMSYPEGLASHYEHQVVFTDNYGANSKEKKETSRKPSHAVQHSRRTSSKGSKELLVTKSTDSIQVQPQVQEEEEQEEEAISAKVAPSFQPSHQSLEPRPFEILPIQSLIYNITVPHPDEAVPVHATVNTMTGASHQIHEAFLLQERFIHLERLHHVVHHVFENTELLRTYLFRNDKIIDADVEGYIESPHAFRSENIIKRIESADAFTNLPAEALAEHVRGWLEQNGTMRPGFQLLYVDDKRAYHEGPNISYIVFVASAANCDESSVTTVARYILNLYYDWDPLLKNPAMLEDSFIGFTKFSESKRIPPALASSIKLKALDYWKTQCIEIQTALVTDSERNAYEQKIEKLKFEKDRAREHITQSKKKKAEIEASLSQMRQQRIDMEADSSAPQTSFVDPYTFETVYIPFSSRTALMKSVLGNPAYGDDIILYLESHGMSETALQGLGEHLKTIEDFCALIENRLSYLSSRERHKVMRLSENARNRIREAIQDHKALKYTLERKIAKLERDLKHISTTLYNLQKQFESADDAQIQLEMRMNPPDLSDKMAPLQIEPSLFESECDNYYEWYDHIMFTVNEDVLVQLREFQDYLCSLEGKTNMEKSNRLHDDEAPKSALLHPQAGPSVAAVCLATFGVILKHISGLDKFLIGVTHDYRKATALGPLSDTMPVKFDFSQKEKTFNALVLDLWVTIKESMQHGLACPSIQVKEHFQLSDLRIEFEMIENKTLNMLSEYGIQADDLLHRSMITDKVQRLWSHREMNSFDLKLKMVDCNDQLKCIMSYRKDLYDYDKVCRWVDKFESALWQVEYSTRKLTPASMISRLYNSVWQSHNQLNGSFGSSVNLRSESSLYQPHSENDQ